MKRTGSFLWEEPDRALHERKKSFSFSLLNLYTKQIFIFCVVLSLRSICDCNFQTEVAKTQTTPKVFRYKKFYKLNT